MKVGVTGTREGATDHQLLSIIEFLKTINSVSELHHGDCKGVDEQVAAIARALGYKTVCHPPVSNYLRAYHPSDEFRPPLGYLQRDRNIVDETELLLVVPLHATRQAKSGTWYTHDYAVRTDKPVKLFLPETKHEML